MVELHSPLFHWSLMGFLLASFTCGISPVYGQGVPDTVNYAVKAQHALELGDPEGCLGYLDRLDGRQKGSARSQWLQLQCMKARWDGRKSEKGFATGLLVKCRQFIAAGSSTDMVKVDQARAWLNEVRTNGLGFDGLKYVKLEYKDVPRDQRATLRGLEDMLSRWTPEMDYPTEMEIPFQDTLKHLVDYDLPLPNGETVFTYCIAKDAKDPVRTLLALPNGADDNKVRATYLLNEAVKRDAPEVVNFLLIEYFSDRDSEMERKLLKLAAEKGAKLVLHQWFQAQTNDRIARLKSWDEYAKNFPMALAEAGMAAHDTAMVNFAIASGIPDENELGKLVFRAIEGGDTLSAVLKVLLNGDLARDWQGPSGMSFLHKAVASDSPIAIKLLYKFGMAQELGTLLDDQGLPAAHYLAIMNLPNIVKDPNALAMLNMNAIDAEGFTLLQKLIFRNEGELRTDYIMAKVLSCGAHINNLDVNKVGPLYSWTALHYAAREDKQRLAKLLMDHNAQKGAKDIWRRTPKDVAKEYGYHL